MSQIKYLFRFLPLTAALVVVSLGTNAWSLDSYDGFTNQTDGIFQEQGSTKTDQSAPYQQNNYYPQQQNSGTYPGNQRSLSNGTFRDDQRITQEQELTPEQAFDNELLGGTQTEEKITTDIGKTDTDKSKLKLGLVVKAEAGDGLARLSWQPAGYRKPQENETIQYRIQIGLAPNRPLKSIDVGNDTTYTLRDLKNHQVYFIQIIAINREQRRIIKSAEIKITPLPREELGSSLEMTFSHKNQTLQDKLTPEPFKRELRQFGYDFFKNSAQLLDAMDNLPVGDNYVLGPGDSLNLAIWGSINARYSLTVDRNGEIVVPRAGVVRVWGLSYEKAKEAIGKAVSRYFKNYDMNISLGKLRTIQVFVVGEVELPGSYPISSLATVVNALSAAGGPTKNGSLRTIKLTRNGKPAENIDLYDMFLSGDRSKDVRLQNGDTIFVPVIGPVVAVAGEVKRPAIYETKGAQSLADVIRMAGGITASGFTGRIQIERFSGNSSRIVLDYEPKDGHTDSATAGIKIQDRDMVKIFPVQEAVRQVVSLRGNAVRPGEYQFRKGMHVKDLIPTFADLLPESYLESAEITRLALPDYHKEILHFNLRKALEGNEAENVALQEQDTIKVFSRWEMQEKPSVLINGFVVNPGKYDFHPGMTVRDLISAAGSPKRNALLDMAELSRVEVAGDKATASRMQIDLGKAISGDPAHNLLLKPDDVLIVRGIVGWTDSTDKFVRLKGEVQYPGVYSVGRGERLSSVIARAGGFTDKAYLRGAKFTRRSVQKEQQKRMDEIIVKTEKEIIQKQAALASIASSKEELEATKSALEGLQKDLDRMKTLKAEGRVVIRLTQIDELKKSSYDLEMEGGDILEIPTRTNVVNVLGQVYNPTAFVYVPENSSVESYLNKAGGSTNDAETSEMFIIKADGTVFSRQQASFGIKWSDDAKQWTLGSFMSSYLEPGDTLVVPQKLERTAWLRDIKDITTIISQIALTAGTVLIGLK
ncbi:SLBB domain-containing protein [Geobacter sp. AOG2]|uniref:SLBB domain-containing protein n=1 Tax=Geobacter sp. AOG2 TaxID=1566347 RepID=UPI001CC679C8|nr:SLBB domain-containing protein [Geobacter sp. AOG2]GFE60880.1 sugar ABC transporter substrate-binding protein [Geobacter sp. AOG2]